MGDRGDIHERMASLEKFEDWARDEISNFREWRHAKAAPVLTTVTMENAGERLASLEAFKNKLLGIVAAASAVGALVGALVDKVLR